MLARWLTTTKDLDRFGVASERLIAAGLSWRTNGRAAITNGLIWSRTIGVLGTDSATKAELAAGMSRAAGSRLVDVGPRSLANVVTFWSVAVVWLSVPGRSLTACEMLPSSEAKVRNTLALESTSSTSWVCLAAR